MKKIRIYGIIVLGILFLTIICICFIVATKSSSSPKKPIIKTETLGYMGILKTNEPVGEYDGYSVIEQDGIKYKVWMEEKNYDKEN